MNTCDHCKKKSEDVRRRNDPFLDEIYEEQVESFWCDECFYDRKDET